MNEHLLTNENAGFNFRLISGSGAFPVPTFPITVIGALRSGVKLHSRFSPFPESWHYFILSPSPPLYTGLIGISYRHFGGLGIELNGERPPPPHEVYQVEFCWMFTSAHVSATSAII